MCVKSDFYIFVPSDLGLQASDLKFAPMVTLIQRYVSTNLEVITFLFREIGMDGCNLMLHCCP